MYRFAQKLILGVDIDNVINNFYIPMSKLIEKKFKIKVDVTKYDLFDKLNMNDSARRKFYEDNIEWLDNNIKPNWRCSLYLHKLQSYFKIIILTARHYNIAPETQNWLIRYDIPFDEIHFNTGNKVDACKFFKVNYMIEDSPFNLRKLNKEGIATLIFNQPFNQRVAETEIATRVTSWEDIYNKLVLR